MIKDGTTPRYFIARERSGDYFIVPEWARAAWAEWDALPSDDDRSWNPPAYAQHLYDGLATLTFTDPREEN